MLFYLLMGDKGEYFQDPGARVMFSVRLAEIVGRSGTPDGGAWTEYGGIGESVGLI